MGLYGFIRFAYPLFPNGAVVFAPYLALLAVIGIVYGALVAWAQEDIKKLVAYSSVFTSIDIDCMTEEVSQNNQSPKSQMIIL